MRAKSRAATTARAAAFVVPVALLALMFLAASARTAPLPVVDTTFTGGPAEGEIVHVEDVRFSFAATLAGAPFPGAHFNCSLDGAPAEPCDSPVTLEELDDGPHTFSVAAEDPTSTAVDPDPAHRSFTIEADDGSECEVIEDEEGDEEEVGCEDDQEEKEREEREAGKKPPASGPPPAACLLRTARARLFTYADEDRVRLVIRYTTSAPAAVHVELRIGPGSGGARIGSASHRFSGKGLFRLAQTLTPQQTARVRTAKGFIVTLSIPAAPNFCERYETRHLTVRKTVHGDVVWFQSDSVFGTAPRHGSGDSGGGSGGSPDGGPGGIGVP